MREIESMLMIFPSVLLQHLTRTAYCFISKCAINNVGDMQIIVYQSRLKVFCFVFSMTEIDASSIEFHCYFL